MQKHRRAVRQAVIIFYVATAAFFVSHSINAYVEHRLISLPGPAVAVSQIGGSTASAIPPGQLAEDIKRSGLFPIPSAAEDRSTSRSSAAAKPKGPPLEAARKLRLLGTIIGASGGTSAVIEELQSKRQGLFHLHDQIPNVGEVAEIRRDGVLIRQDEQEELLPPAILQPDATSVPAVTPASQPAFAPPSRRMLDRREVAEATSNPSKLLSQAHAVPHLGKDGLIDGFRLDFVAPASFFEKAGLQYGDMIQRVNGVEIKDPAKIWTLFQQLRDERIVKLDVVRNSQPTTLTYEIR